MSKRTGDAPGDVESPRPKPVRWLTGRPAVPPQTVESRREIGAALLRLQFGATLGMPLSRPMPSIGPGVHELRVRDARHYWRVVYRADADAVVVASMFPKTTPRTPKAEIETARRRLAAYDGRDR